MSVDTRREPPQHIIDLAVEVAGWSPCRSKRGVVIHHDGSVIAHGHNYKPRGFECDGSEACKATCRYEAVHAEEAAIVAAGGRPKTDGAEMVHVKAVDGKLVESGPPSCVRCSTLVLASGVSGVWLYQESMWCRYPSTLFHSLSIDANRALLTERDEAIERGRQLETAARELEAARDEAIRQREAAEARVAYLMTMVTTIRQDLADAEARAATLEQERDEALAAASQFERLNDAAQEAFNVKFKEAATLEARVKALEEQRG